MPIADLEAFLGMGGYAEFVWPAYLAVVVILGGLSVQSWWRYRESMRMLEKLQQAGRPRR